MVPRIAAAADIDDFDFFLFPTGTNRLYFYAELWYVNPNSAPCVTTKDGTTFCGQPVTCIFRDRIPFKHGDAIRLSFAGGASHFFSEQDGKRIEQA